MRRLGSRRCLAAEDFYFDIVAALSVHLVRFPPRMKSSAQKRIFDKISGGIELWVVPHIALADFSRELLDIGTEFAAQRTFVIRQRRGFRKIFSRHPHSNPPE